MAGLPVCPTARPNDDDLTGVVTHLAPLTTRRGVIERDPNEPEVRWLLEAGIRAMCEGLLDQSSEATGPMAYSHANGLFDTLPVERVMRCFRDMCTEQRIDPGSANKARLIRRWSFAANYQLDLIAYVFRPAVLDHSITEAERAVREAFPRPSMGELVHSFCHPRSEFSPVDSIIRIQHVLRLMFPSDAAIKRYSAALNDLKCRRWGTFSEEFARACGLSLQGIDHVDLAAVMHLVVEAAVLQPSAAPYNASVPDRTTLAVLTMRMVLESAYGLPWDEIAPRRPATPPAMESGAATPTELPEPHETVSVPASTSADQYDTTA